MEIIFDEFRIFRIINIRYFFKQNIHYKIIINQVVRRKSDWHSIISQSSQMNFFFWIWHWHCYGIFSLILLLLVLLFIHENNFQQLIAQLLLLLKSLKPICLKIDDLCEFLLNMKYEYIVRHTNDDFIRTHTRKCFCATLVRK